MASPSDFLPLGGIQLDARIGWSRARSGAELYSKVTTSALAIIHPPGGSPVAGSASPATPAVAPTASMH